MKKVNLIGWIILLSAIVLVAFAIVGDAYGGFSKFFGQTAKEASQVVPVSQKIRLNVEHQRDGILLTWKNPKDVSGNYYDVYRRFPGLEAGWGERIGRIILETSFSGSYEFTDSDVTVGQKYIYQIILVKASNGYEVKDQSSDSIEITFK